MGVNFNPIVLEDVQKNLLKIWQGPGVIECGDVGPRRCLITFETKHIKNEAMVNEALLLVFDEDILSLSRRIWVEVMGIPVYVWSEDTFKNISKIWGNYVYADDRTGESMSFTVARFLIDCFEWEYINEWITIKVEDREFEVHVKEFGCEVYSRESHPNELEKAMILETTEQTTSKSLVAETQLEGAAGCPLTVEKEYSNNVNIGQFPLIENETMEINGVNEEVDVGGKFTMHDDEGDNERLKEVEESELNKEWVCSTQVEPNNAEGVIERTKSGDYGPQTENGPVPDISASEMDSCPFPPGFGPCTSEDHVHRSLCHGLSQQEEMDTTRGEERIEKSLETATKQGINDGGVLNEAIGTKELCEVGGISFKEKDEIDLLVKIVGAKSLKKTKQGSASKKQRTMKAAPNLKGKNYLFGMLGGWGG
ncbi:hypothetical protein PIB30_016235 [Stylosanthes scabra]|uniref:DUF4283 domain-containing protein n=1 Tax=Stylosanthes scabra TaxID=79078 RepID=A0ABU6X4U5_9FABA|nr:hypothetical protein [Stylosanthes scabra]